MNKKLAQALIDSLQEHPIGYHMSSWSTCLAGRTVQISGLDVGEMSNHVVEDTAMYLLDLPNPDLFHIMDWARFRNREQCDSYQEFANQWSDVPLAVLTIQDWMAKDE